jgi:excinuclease ABC subunit C
MSTLMVKISINVPSLPGVYLFKRDTEILYVGKAKCLKKRVGSYFQKQGTDWKIDSLIKEHTHIEHIITHNETEALLLEAQLIRDNKPKFNVLLKSGQPFIYIMFTNQTPRQIEIVRNKKEKGIYFGPFLQKKQARSAYLYIMKTFKLTMCKTKIQNGCLRYHLGSCAGNCRADFDAEGYNVRIELALDLLQGHYNQSIKKLTQQIKTYTQQLEFEKARNMHYYLQNLETIFTTLKTRFSEKKYEREIFLTTSPIDKKLIEDPYIAQKIQDALGLQKAPSTIDCFDISHFQSSYMVGSCIRFKNGIPDKNNFRRFKIKTLTQQNDYAALQEIVSRRYKNPEDIPDLILIDGGKGQLNAIISLFPEAQIVSLAKREELIFTPHSSQPIPLSLNTDVGRLLIALRDYAHHFAINYHKLLRHKNASCRQA